MTILKLHITVLIKYELELVTTASQRLCGSVNSTLQNINQYNLSYKIYKCNKTLKRKLTIIIVIRT